MNAVREDPGELLLGRHLPACSQSGGAGGGEGRVRVVVSAAGSCVATGSVRPPASVSP